MERSKYWKRYQELLSEIGDEFLFKDVSEEQKQRILNDIKKRDKENKIILERVEEQMKKEFPEKPRKPLTFPLRFVPCSPDLPDGPRTKHNTSILLVDERDGSVFGATAASLARVIKRELELMEIEQRAYETALEKVKCEA